MQPFGESFSHDSKQRLGQILVESHLISEAKLYVALYEQQLFNLRLGEILAAHGWIDHQTADFFADQWVSVKYQDIRYPLGQYLKAAGLLNDTQIVHILKRQKENGDRFGNSAVQLGLILPETIEYFLSHLFPESLKPTLNFSDRATLLQLSDDNWNGRHLYN